MRSLVRLGAVLFYAARLALRPGHLPSVFGLVRAMNTPAQLSAMRAQLLRTPHAAVALAAPFAVVPDLDALCALPPGTLGRAFADFTRVEGVEPRVLTDEARRESDWISVHLYEVHDIWHVVLGIGTDVVSEVQILAFMLTQLPRTRMAPIAITVAMVRAVLGHPELTPVSVLRAVAAGSAAGEQAELFFGIDWGQLWSQPLSEVRAGLGVQVRAAAG